MFVTYFDEIKANPNNGVHHYFVGGLAIPFDKIESVEKKITELSREIFDSADLAPETEFHASYIFFGKGNFKGKDVQTRLHVLEKLADILNEEQTIGRIYACINTNKMKFPDEASELAFVYFCERLQMYLTKSRKSILIGDLDNKESKKMISRMVRYRATGTPMIYGMQINSVVDTVHFAQSHHSRLLQLSDVYLFLASHFKGTRKGWMADKLSTIIAARTLYPNRYKEWPAT